MSSLRAACEQCGTEKQKRHFVDGICRTCRNGPRKTWTLITLGLLEDLYFKRGWTQKRIAEHLGFRSPMPVTNAFLRLGLRARTGGISRFGKDNPSWKGDKLGYAGCHRRVESARGKPQSCEGCGTQGPLRKGQYEWANLSGKYYDPFDYVRLCSRCHRKRDKNYLNLQGVKRMNHRKRLDQEAKR